MDWSVEFRSVGADGRGWWYIVRDGKAVGRGYRSSAEAWLALDGALPEERAATDRYNRIREAFGGGH